MEGAMAGIAKVNGGVGNRKLLILLSFMLAERIVSLVVPLLA